jgi:DNA-directed RNA polymerase subunit RPC12/RpoP
MTFPCTCRTCGHVNDVEWSQIGRQIPCGRCGKTMTVPAPMETAGAAAEPAPSPTLRFSCPACGRKFATKPEMAGKKIACNRCGAGVRVPQADAAAVAPSSRPAMKTLSGNDATAAPRTDRGRAARAVADSGESSSLLDELAAIEEVDEPRHAGAVLPSRSELREQARQKAAEQEAVAAQKEKKKKKKKRRKKAEGGDALDKRVLAAVGAVGVVFAGLVGFFVYDAFLKPPSIVGTWAGSMIEFEIGKPIIHTQYRLVLDEQNRASMTLQEKFTSVGTYSLKGNRLKLSLKEKDEDGQETLSSEREYKVSLGRASLDLYDPKSGQRVVQLIRFREPPSVGGGPKPPATPKDVAGGGDKVDADADARLASVEFSPKDGAFRLRHPPGWTSDTGSRPDNSYSWATFTKGSAKIRVTADLQGSLISGSDSAPQVEEGSPMKPVHRAHEHHKRAVSEEYSNYNESEPALFKGSQLGEGRIATFTATSGLLGSKIRGYRTTLLTNDRRVTILSECPAKDFEKLKPTFLAVCRSLAR